MSILLISLTFSIVFASCWICSSVFRWLTIDWFLLLLVFFLPCNYYFLNLLFSVINLTLRTFFMNASAAEAPIESVGTPTLEKGVEKSSTENRTKIKLDNEGVAALDSIPAESPKTQYNQNVTASSRSKGRFFLFCS